MPTFATSSAFQAGLIVLLVGLYAMQSMLPAWSHVQRDGTGMDFASFHYAVKEALDGGDPYDTAALTRRGQLDKTRPYVFPYLYPPAFLPFMAWSAPLALHTAYVAWFWVNQVTLLLLALALRRWLGAPWLLLAFLFASFSPLMDNAAYGQVNLVVLLLVVVGLWRSSGVALSLAAMIKMSPLLYLVDWVVRGKIRPLFKCAGFAVGLGALSLAVVNWDAQWTFVTEVLPSFSTGVYNNLAVPIEFPMNHSLPNLFNQLWPGPTPNTLDPKARAASTLVTLLSIAGLVRITRGARRRTREAGEGAEEGLSEACMAGAWTALITVLPVYTWEHHLVFLLLPLAAIGTAAVRGHLRGFEIALLILGYCCVIWPAELLVLVYQALPALGRWLQESKFIGTVIIGVLCAVASARCVKTTS